MTSPDVWQPNQPSRSQIYQLFSEAGDHVTSPVVWQPNNPSNDIEIEPEESLVCRDPVIILW